MPFGYKKSPMDKNDILIDEYAANVVKDIFKWKLEGMNQSAIAERLNQAGVPSPLEYKNANGSNFSCGFKMILCFDGWPSVIVIYDFYYCK